jgi:hypothetical protein
VGNFAEFFFQPQDFGGAGNGGSPHQLCLRANAHRMSTSTGLMDGIDPDKLTLANVKDGTIK